MSLSVSERCRTGLATLRQIILLLSQSDRNDRYIKYVQVNEELDRFSLFVGNIGALHQPQSSMSLESRLHEARDVLIHIQDLLTDLNEVAEELLEIVSGGRKGMVAYSSERIEGDCREINEVDELREEISEVITRLFRASILIRQAAPTDLFAKTLSRNRYHINDQFDIAHVGEKYCKLATDDSAWLRRRLGRAITQRRRYLSYIRDHHEKLEGTFVHHDETDTSTDRLQALAIKQSLASRFMLETASNHSFLTKATTIAPSRITPQLLAAGDSEPEDDAVSYTTISRSIDEDHDSPTTVRIPKLDALRVGSKKEIQCPFCFRIKKFKNERTWRKHVFSDLRSYVCTFPDCDAPYFGDINEWFKHEMTVHRVTYKCFLCTNASFHRESNYLSHVRREHAEILRDRKEQLEINLVRKPLAQIPVSDCPCCSDWADRLRARMVQNTEPRTDNDKILAVIPTVFKRHLASHLEQLALFAIPIGAAADGDESSNAAIEERNSKGSDISQMSTLTFQTRHSRSDPDDAKLDSGADSFEDHGSCANSQKTGTGEDLISMTDLASTYQNEGRWKEAEELWVEVMKTNKAKLGAEHPNTLTSMAQLALTYSHQDRWEEAEKLQLEGLEKYKIILGEMHPHTLGGMSNLALTYNHQDRWEEAEKLQLEVMETNRMRLGAEHSNTLAIMSNLASTYGNQNRWEEAEKLQVEVMRISKEKLGAKHPITMTRMCDLASTWRSQGRDAEAADLMRKCVQLHQEVPVEHQPISLHALWLLNQWEAEDAEKAEQANQAKKAEEGDTETKRDVKDESSK